MDFILEESDTLQPAAELVAQIADLEQQAYRLIDEAARKGS